MHETSTNEERVLAALAHAGVLANGFNLLGLVGAIVIWATQRKQSRYVADHALQALIFQVVSLLFTIIMLVVWGGFLFIALLPAWLRPDLYQDELPLTFRVVLFAGLLIGFFLVVVIGYGVAGALAAWRGRPFHYLFIDSLLSLREDAGTQQAPGPQQLSLPLQVAAGPTTAATSTDEQASVSAPATPPAAPDESAKG